ncbi:MAG: thioredoxin domain-containing protein [Thermodesulfobacteriota bacterium]
MTARRRLAAARSPYLRQHADDAVDWYPWGEEALGRARAEGRLIFLSIGYATCHWCHVMGRESFSDQEVGDYVSRHFVPILVDCEERPDLNQLYMKSCRLLLDGYSGWPLNVVASPDQVPLLAAVYLPKRSAHGRTGLLDLLERAAAEWQRNPEELLGQGRRIVTSLTAAAGGIPGQAAIDQQTLAVAAGAFREEYDPRHGGFGPDPRFVRPHGLIFLLRHAWRWQQPALRGMVEKTLTAVWRGGIFDQLGGGVHRYATDVAWRHPHFEKMLYDQAGLLLAACEAFRATGRPRYAAMARAVMAYVLRDLQSPDGVFWAGEDADAEGIEGGYYLWRREEIVSELGPDEGDLFCAVYEVTGAGNFRPADQGQGSNVLYRRRSVAAWAGQLGLAPAGLAGRLARARQRLFARRRRRSSLRQDRQVILAWNALMVSALVQAGQALAWPPAITAAERAARWLLRQMRPNGELRHCWQDGLAFGPAVAADYACLAASLLDLYEAVFDPLWLSQALELARELLTRFGDPAGGGLFETAAGDSSLLVRLKDPEEREMPSANSMALDLLARLWLLAEDDSWRAAAEGIRAAFATEVRAAPADFPWLVQASSWLVASPRKVVVAGPSEAAATKSLLAAARQTYAPDAVFLLRRTDVADDPLLALAPGVRDLAPAGGQAAAYVCAGFACQRPLTDPQALARLLARPIP